MPKKEHPSVSGAESHKSRHRTPLWQAVLLPIVSILIFFGLLEGGLALFGVLPAQQAEDPFVGFSANAPLFVPAQGENGQPLLMTARNKIDFFNHQVFPQKKAPNTLRIFTLGGSTTYGRPYDDSTSFSGWLRELLPLADQTKQWEVINAGGISYASYRITQLMEELVDYQPDLFIIYTGHNEFLEERTYRELKDIPPLILSASSLLAKTRTWTAMNSALKQFGTSPEVASSGRFELSGEVDAILDQSAGLDRYKRDGDLQTNIIQHFQISLENMVSLARSVGAKVIFVTPAANLKDSSPFKSQHTDDISQQSLKQAENYLNMSKPMFWAQNWGMALGLLDQAIRFDPQFADLRYRRGQALFGLGRYKEAKQEFLLARDLDVCPLRAITPLQQVLAQVARERKVALVDYPALLEQRLRAGGKPTILGEQYFLDHVHPTVEGHKLLAEALLLTMTEQGLAHPAKGWQRDALIKVSAKIEGGLKPVKQGMALANVARVLLWAGKVDDAAQIAERALKISKGSQQVLVNAGTSLATAYVRNGRYEHALKLLYSYLEQAPDAVELRLKLGQVLLDRHQTEEAAANFLFVTQKMPYYDWGHAMLGISMVDRGRIKIAYASLREALGINPNNASAKQWMEKIRGRVDEQASASKLMVKMTHYSSAVPHRLIQGTVDSNGQFVPDGIEVEFYENGRLKRFLDIESGRPKGVDIHWDLNGKQLSRQVVN